MRKEASSAAESKRLDVQIHAYSADVRNASAIKNAVSIAAKDLGIQTGSGQLFDILISTFHPIKRSRPTDDTRSRTRLVKLDQTDNASLALGAPAPFWQQSLDGVITTMIQTNIFGFMVAAHAILNEGGMANAGKGIILNVTSTTALGPPPFPCEAIYHASKACQEAFSKVLRNETVGTNIRIPCLRPGIVQTNFHQQRVGYDRGQYGGFMREIKALVGRMWPGRSCRWCSYSRG